MKLFLDKVTDINITITPKAIMSSLQISYGDIDKKAKEEICKGLSKLN